MHVFLGSALLAMAGNKCVGIASDRRFGERHQMVSMNMDRIFKSSYTVATSVPRPESPNKVRLFILKMRSMLIETI